MSDFKDYPERLEESCAKALAEITSLNTQLDALGFTVEVIGPDNIGQFTAHCLEVPGALGCGSTLEEARLSSMRAILPIIKAREEQQDAQLAKAQVNIASLADYVNTWAREWGIRETGANLPDIKKTLDMLWGEASVTRNALTEVRADADALAVALETGPSGKLAALGWSEVDGQQKFRAVIVFEEAPYGLGLKISDVWNHAPVKIIKTQALASRPEAARKRAEAVMFMEAKSIAARSFVVIGDFKNAMRSLEEGEAALHAAWGME